MHIAKYFVVYHEEQWKIRYSDTLYGPYDRQKTAISQAIDMALIVGQAGGTAQVLVENERGEARLEWPLAHDLATTEHQRLTDLSFASTSPAQGSTLHDAEEAGTVPDTGPSNPESGVETIYVDDDGILLEEPSNEPLPPV